MIINFEAYFPKTNILSIFEKINILENLIILIEMMHYYDTHGHSRGEGKTLFTTLGGDYSSKYGILSP